MPARPHFAHSNLGLGSKNRKSSSEKHSAPVPHRTDGSKCYAHLEVPNTFNHCINTQLRDIPVSDYDHVFRGTNYGCWQQ